MRAKDLRAEQVGKHLNVSAQTVRNWRVSGIPPRKQLQVREMIANWDQRPAALLGRIILSPTPTQFDNWNDAAMAKGLRISEWAVKGLDKLAKDHKANPPAQSAAAEAPRFRTVPRDEVEQDATGTEGK